MDGFGDAFRSSVRDYVGLYEENQKLKEQMNGRMAAMQQALNLCTISGPGGTPVYATGSKPGILLEDRLTWVPRFARYRDLPGHLEIDLAPLQGEEGTTPPCPIEDVSNAEFRAGNRVFRFADADRTEGDLVYFPLPGEDHDTEVNFHYLFRYSQYIEVRVLLTFCVSSATSVEWEALEAPNLGAAGTAERLSYNIKEKDLANPSNLRNDQVTTPVRFRLQFEAVGQV